MKDKGPVWDRYCQMKEMFPDALVVCGANVPKDGMVYVSYGKDRLLLKKLFKSCVITEVQLKQLVVTVAVERKRRVCVYEERVPLVGDKENHGFEAGYYLIAPKEAEQ
jgi:hypothetical protein